MDEVQVDVQETTAASRDFVGLPDLVEQALGHAQLLLRPALTTASSTASFVAGFAK